MEVNQHTNLTRIDEADVDEKHFLDCLRIEPYLKAGDYVADLGSGAGFPGLVLALVRPDCRFDLIEATGKRCDFLNQIKHDLHLDHVNVLQARAEDLQDAKERYDVVTARAVARLNILLELSLPLLKIGGTLIAMKGSNADSEVQEAMSAMKLLKVHPPKRDVHVGEKIGTHINLIFSKTQACPSNYPRSYATIKKKAL